MYILKIFIFTLNLHFKIKQVFNSYVQWIEKKKRFQFSTLNKLQYLPNRVKSNIFIKQKVIPS